jgi:hypothetical protein
MVVKAALAVTFAINEQSTVLDLHALVLTLPLCCKSYDDGRRIDCAII